MVATYGVLFAFAIGVFVRIIRMTGASLRENMLFSFLAILCILIRMLCATHYSEYMKFPVGLVDVLMVNPYAILYWINGHFFRSVRIQRIESTEARVRWRVEPLLRFVLGCVFLGMLVLLTGLGLDASSQAAMAIITSRAIAAAFTLANVVFCLYSVVVLAGWTIGRSDPQLTKALGVMSFASLLETSFWIIWPTNGLSLYAAFALDMVAIGVLIYKYRNPREDFHKSQSKNPLDLTDDNDLADYSRPSISTDPPPTESPRRPSTQLPAPPATTANA